MAKKTYSNKNKGGESCESAQKRADSQKVPLRYSMATKGQKK